MLKLNGKAVKRPAVVVDTVGYVVIKMGEYEDMLEYYRAARKIYSELDYSSMNRILKGAGLPKIDVPVERTLELVELPQNQEVIDNVLHKSGYLENYIGKKCAKNVTKINFEPIE